MNKNKYQEALEFITDHTKADCKTIKDLEGLEFAYDTLQELVDKETPMKPIEYDGQIPWVSYNCPNCLWTISSVMKESYCETCGQKIDWSDEE